MKPQDHAVRVIGIIILVVVLMGFILDFLGFGFGIRGFKNYGIDRLCSTVGGIWCYWPTPYAMIALVVFLVVLGVLIWIIVWIYRKVPHPKDKLMSENRFRGRIEESGQ